MNVYSKNPFLVSKNLMTKMNDMFFGFTKFPVIWYSTLKKELQNVQLETRYLVCREVNENYDISDGFVSICNDFKG